jgi:L-arabinose transport system substrate-binding protein
MNRVMKGMRAPRAIAIAATSIALVFAVSACTSGQTTDSGSGSTVKKTGAITIAYLQKQGDQQYFIDEANGAKAAAKASGSDVTVKVVNLGTDANAAISQVEASIAQKVDGLIVVVPDQKIGPQVISDARAANIPIMASDDVTMDSSGKAIPFAGFDGTAMGTLVGSKAAELYKAAGWTASDTVILSGYKEDLSVCSQRVDAAKASFTKDAGTAPKVIDIGTDNSVTDAQDKAGAVITANGSVKHWVVWGCNDENETGIVTALQNANIAPADIIGVGLGAYLTCKDWAAGQNTGNKAALFISGAAVGKAAMTSMIAKIRKGTALPAQSIAKTAMVDATNWKAAGVVCT